ncbi:MAG: filamentous hemagglutinin N-terminal domain-containing protein [Candidatus Methylomirabilales bacterium]
MASNHPNHYWVTLLRRTLLLAGLLLLTALQAVSQAQVTTAITPDGTLGTTVTQVGSTFNIEGGTRPGPMNDGPNLFHSFGSFSIGTGDIGNFNNETGMATTNILSRVTGGNPSNIFGTIRTTGFPGANLFLLNPAGVLFGPTASLDVSGSFHVSTADFLRFEDGAKFFADLSQDSMLTVAPPAAFGFLSQNPASITFEGSGSLDAETFLGLNGITVPEGETLSVIGGDINVTGGLLFGFFPVESRLRAPGGRINVVNVASPGEAVVGPSGVYVSSFDQLGNINVEGSEVDVSAEGGGTVVIRGGRLMIDNANIFADTLGDVDGASTGIDVEVAGEVVITNGSFVTTDFTGSGDPGDIHLDGQSIEVSGASFLGSRGFPGSTGDPGDVRLVTESALVTGASSIQSSTALGGTGVGGRLTIDAYSIDILGGSLLDVSGQAGGGVLIVGESFLLDGASEIRANTLGALPGVLPGIDIDVTGDLVINNSTLQAATGSDGDAGGVRLSAGQDVVLTLAGISTFSLAGGSAGDLEIHAGRDLQIDRTDIDTSSEGFLASAGSVLLDAGQDASYLLTNIDTSSFNLFAGTGGDVAMSAGRDLAFGFGSINTSTDSFFGFRAGDVAITAGHYALIEVSDLGTQSLTSTGRGGDVTVTADTFTLGDLSNINTFSASDRSGNVTVNVETYRQVDRSAINTSMLASGQAGNITITATNSAELVGQTGSNPFSRVLNASVAQLAGLPVPDGDAGIITIVTPDLTFDNAIINAGAGGMGQGGSIVITGGETLTALKLTALNGTLLTTAALDDAAGGSITIDTDQSIVFSGGSGILNSPANGMLNSPGAGPVILRSPIIEFTGDGTGILTGPSGSADAGPIVFETERLTVAAGARVGSIVEAGATGRASDITITASDSVTVSSTSTATSGILSATFGEGDAGDISISGPDDSTSKPVVLLDGGLVGAPTAVDPVTGEVASGGSGNITFSVAELTLQNGALLQATAIGATSVADAGVIDIEASQRVLLDGTGAPGVSISSGAEGASAAGEVRIRTPDLALVGNAFIDSGTVDGPGGGLVIDVARLALRNGAALNSSTSGDGLGGTVQIDASESVSISGSTADGNPSKVASATLSTGDAGIVLITTPLLSMTGGLITTTAQKGAAGDAGSITLNVGTLDLQAGGRVASSSVEGATGAAGSVTVQGLASPANSVTLTNSELLTRVEGDGEGGSIAVDAANVTLTDTTISASVTDVPADGDPASGLGNIVLTAPTLQMNGGSITAESSGSRNAGNITIAAANTLESTNSTITTTASLADGGNITILVGGLVQQIDSLITSSVGNPEKTTTIGGNIEIDPQFVILQNSQIRANAFAGTGGNIKIVAGVFLADPDSVVDASSQLGIDGEVDIQSPVTNLSGTLAPLPEAVLQATALLREACAARVRGGQVSSLVVGGRDGVPLEPGGLLPSPLYRGEGEAVAPSAGHEGNRPEEPAFSVGLLGADPIVLSPVRGWSEPGFAQATLNLMCSQ